MKILSILFLVSFFCSTNKTDNSHKNTDTPLVTKTYQQEPVHQLKISSSLSYIVKINGLTTATKNQNSGEERSFLINNTIPKSGDQSIEITILPRLNNAQDQHLSTIQENDFFSLQVEKTAWKNGSLEEPKIIYYYELPINQATNKNVFTQNATFKAEVPYQLTDWREGKDLTKIDAIQLEKDVVAFYEKNKHYYENQQGENFVKSVEIGMYNLAQGAYMDSEDFLQLKQEEVQFIDEEPTPLEKLEHYQLEISGNGKLVSLKRNDGYNTGEGVLRRTFNEGGEELIYVDDLTLYIPKGKDSLEVIHYQNLEKPYYP